MAMDDNRTATEIYNQYGGRLIPKFYQRIPTEFRLKFATQNNIPPTYEDMKDEYVDIELASDYIPDVNRYEYPKLNDIIIATIKEMLPLFFWSIVGDRYRKSENYKKILFNWCKQRKILRFIIKSQQHEFNNSHNDEIGFNSSFHIEGTIQEQIGYIGILSSRIDPSIRAGNLHLRYDINYSESDWKLKPFEGSMIVFPNMPHCITDLTSWNHKELGVQRSLELFL